MATGSPGNQGGIINSYVYDKLIAIGPDPKTGKTSLLPYAATKWSVTPSQIVFTVRKGVTCADGTPVTPTVIKNSYALMFKDSPNATSLWGSGAKTITADDANNTVTFNFSTPNSLAIYGFADARQGIMCPSGVNDPSSLTATPAGSGPYTLVSAVHDQQLVFKKRADWTWGPNGTTAKDLPEQVTLQIVGNSTTATTLLLNGQLDLANVGPSDLSRAEGNSSLTHTTATSSLSDVMLYNQAPGHPTDDEKVRQALSAAINEDQWAQASGRAPSTSYLSPQSECYDPGTAQLMPKDPGPAAAKQILESDGYQPNSSGDMVKDGKKLTIDLWSDATSYQEGPDYLVSQWEAAGITVDAHVTDFATYLATLSAGNFDAYTAEYPFTTPNPGTYVYGFVGPSVAQGGSDYISNFNPTTLAAVVKARATSGAESCKEWSIVQTSLLQGADIFPLGYEKTNWFSKGINNWPTVLLPDIRFMSAAKG
jgi:peptide/nickel transport system substrate-binding protein